MERKPAHLVRAAEAHARREAFQQRLNPSSWFTGTDLASEGGLTRTGVGVAWLPPGKDSFAYHAHRYKEEWIYILSGRVISRVDGVETELGPGDFVAFPTPSVPHLLCNRSDADVVYLMGGERTGAAEVIDYPDLGKTYLLARSDGQTGFWELGAPSFPFGPADE